MELLEVELNAAAAEGWRVVTVLNQEGNKARFNAVLERVLGA